MATGARMVDRCAMVRHALNPLAAGSAGVAMRHTAQVARRVLVVDDHATFRAAARRLLRHAGYDVVGEAPDGARAIELAGELAPELVLLDVHLPDMSGFTVAERLAGTATIVMTSTHDEPELADIARRHGAWGFISKGELTPAGLAEACPPL